ncbi:hypothetical protein U9M48_037022 [Paspalum notatum var. saurae]|uniref:F-box domain-containing protein n=1 Tax=Paspalum notatum var. saurae TaxID=547442 RepID=A0AAQ3UF48_PASNO
MQQPPWRRPPPPPTAKSQAPTATTIHDLRDDLLREIFLRLPSLPSLVRAALTCRAFLAAVRSSPAFRRRFRSLHPPPLLGFFFESIGSDIASFSPLRRRSDPDAAAAVRGGDVCLTRLPYNDDALPGWKIEKIRGGCLLLLNWSAQQLAVYNPLTRALDLLPMPPDEILRSGCVGELSYMDFFLLCPDEVLSPPSPFRVVSLFHDSSRVRASVFSSGTREWLVLPWSEAAPAQPSGVEDWLLCGAEASGGLYFAHAEQAYMVVLDTTTLQYSLLDLPEHLEGAGHLYMIGETKDGELCIVSVGGFTLHIWYRRAWNNAGDEMWMLDSVIPLEMEILEATEIPEDEIGMLRLKVYAVLDGIVYMFTIEEEPSAPSWFLSFCLETGELEKLFRRTFDNLVFPYFMPWPSLLVGHDMGT